MVANEIGLTTGPRALLVSSDEFAAVFTALADQAKRSIQGAYYLLTAFPDGDLHRSQRRALMSLVNAQARGVSVRLVVGWPSLDSSRRRNAVASLFLEKRNVEVRAAADSPFHYKFCVFDDLHCLVGSHNLTTGALVENVEMSVALEDAGIAKELTALHQRLWQSSRALRESSGER
jgi:phosphatidylserine/phosphatidylglycerophosphate/cardiolipin synthase-like enzyme